MKISLNRSHPISDSEIVSFEEAAAIRLPTQYREFVLKFNAAKPETNIFSIPGGSNQSGVNAFIPLERVLAESKNVDGIDFRFVAVAWAEGGNYVCINLDSGGEVYFWDHEEPSGLLRLTRSWNEFLEILEPFDVSKIELRPGQVKTAWIDPEFLKGLKKSHE